MKDYIKKKTVSICIIAFAIAILIICITILPKMLKSNGGTVTTISKASLEKVIEINELSTLEYAYNAITKVYDKDGEKIKYYVAYEGIVNAGIDFTEIDIDLKNEEKRIVITLPEVTVQGVHVDMGSLDYIFTSQKYETETVSQEAYKASLDDLEKKAKEEQSLLSIARDNAIATIKGLISPWIEQIDGEYKIEVK